MSFLITLTGNHYIPEADSERLEEQKGEIFQDSILPMAAALQNAC